MKKIFGLTLALLLLMIAANGLWAQTATTSPTGILESPQSISTQGRYRSNADDFIRSDYYANVKFNTFYAYSSFAPFASATSTNTGLTNMAALGFATKLGGAYLAAYYGGNFWSNKSRFNHNDANYPFNGGDKTFPSYATPTISTTDVPQNRFALLLGIANMGIRLSYASTHNFFNKDDIVVTGTPNAYYKSYKTAFGVIAPQIEWAMAKDLTEKNGLRPKVGVTLNLSRDYLRSQAYNAVNGTAYDEQITRSNNYVEPHLVINPNGFHVYNKNGFRLTLDLDYELRLRMFSNEYNYTDGGDVKTNKIKGYNTGTALSEKSYIDNLLTPSLAGQWSGGNLALRFKLNLPLGFNSEGTTAVTDNNGNLQKNGTDAKAFDIRFQPNLRLAAQWKALPDKLHLNIGARLDLSNLSRTTTKTSTYIADVKNDNADTKGVTTTLGATRNAFGLGITFLPTENLIFEACAGITTGNNNQIRVFAADGIFTFGSILASLKF